MTRLFKTLWAVLAVLVGMAAAANGQDARVEGGPTVQLKAATSKTAKAIADVDRARASNWATLNALQQEVKAAAASGNRDAFLKKAAEFDAAAGQARREWRSKILDPLFTIWADLVNQTALARALADTSETPEAAAKRQERITARSDSLRAAVQAVANAGDDPDLQDAALDDVADGIADFIAEAAPNPANPQIKSEVAKLVSHVQAATKMTEDALRDERRKERAVAAAQRQNANAMELARSKWDIRAVVAALTANGPGGTAATQPTAETFAQEGMGIVPTGGEADAELVLPVSPRHARTPEERAALLDMARQLLNTDPNNKPAGSK